LILSKSGDRKLIKSLKDKAKETSTEVHIVTEETTEGVQFNNLGGIGGILRYEIRD